MLFRRLIASLLLLLLATQTCDKLLLMADFYANQSYIAQTLCENRAKPELRCCGKCVLRKKMAQQEKGSSESQDQRAGTGVLIVSSRTFFPVIDILIEFSSIDYGFFQPGSLQDKPSRCFHPPSVIV